MKCVKCKGETTELEYEKLEIHGGRRKGQTITNAKLYQCTECDLHFFSHGSARRVK